jgi:hypothetical protein
MKASYHVIPFRDGWGIDHDNEVVGPYATKAAAFQAASMAAVNAIKLGYEIDVTVPAHRPGESALGA